MLHIKNLIDKGDIEEAICQLDALIESQPDNDAAFFQRGKLYWKIGETARAMNDYATAARINPDSPAATALEHSHDIQNFFNPDLLNP